jgi:hypothetical protein
MNSLFCFEQIDRQQKDTNFLCDSAIIMITLTACTSTSAFQTGSQNMTRDAEIKFLPRQVFRSEARRRGE